MADILRAQFRKLFMRTEWQAFLIAVIVMFCNRFLEWGLTEADVWGMFIGSGMYAGSRGLVKRKILELTNDAG